LIKLQLGNRNRHQASITVSEIQQQALHIERCELELKNGLDQLQIPMIPNVLNRHCRGMSMDSATSTQTAFMLREYAKMIESIEQHQDSILEENSSDLSIKLE